MTTAAKFATIRQTASLGFVSEGFIRRMVAQGNCPGLYSGNRFLVNVNASSRVGMRAFSNSPEGNSSSPEGNPLAGINTTATKDIEGAVSGMKRAVLTELSALMPSFVERVKFANQSMIPNSAQTISIQGDNQSAESWRGQGSGIVEHKVKIEIMPRELARFLHPYLSEEEKRVGVDLAT